MSDGSLSKHTYRWGMARTAVAALSGLSLLIVAGCSGGPNEVSKDSTSFTSAAEATTKQLNDIYAQVEGLDRDARKAKLIELAKKESGDIVWYTAAADDDTAPMIKQFKEDTGLTVQVYRASSAKVLTRTIEEAKAGLIRGDILNFSGLDPTIGSHNSLYAQLKTPYAEDMVEGAVHKDWIADQFYPFTVTWNTDRVKPADAPKTFKELLTKFPDGELAFESTDSNWLYGMVTQLQDEGMSEQEAIDLVKEATRKGVPVTGHTLISELLAAGQYSAVVNAYQYRSARQKSKGAPVEWEPQPEPVLTVVSGTAISATTKRPASSLLFIDYQLTGEQEYWGTAGRTPTNKNYKGGIDQDKYKLRILDDEAMYKDLEKWDSLYAEMMQSSGRPIRKD